MRASKSNLLSCYAGIPVDRQRRTCTSVRPCGLYFAVVVQWIFPFFFFSLNVFGYTFLWRKDAFKHLSSPFSSIGVIFINQKSREGTSHCIVGIILWLRVSCYLRNQFLTNMKNIYGVLWDTILGKKYVINILFNLKFN